MLEGVPCFCEFDARGKCHAFANFNARAELVDLELVELNAREGYHAFANLMLEGLCNFEFD